MTKTQDTAGVCWQLRPLLERHNLSAYQLVQQLRGKMNAGSVYALARGETERVSLATLGHLLAALEGLTGQRYTVADLLAYDPVEDDSQLMAASASDLREQLADLEATTPPHELSNWSAAFENGGA